MLYPHTRLRHINKQIGFGMVATRLIPRGTITWVRDRFDQLFLADEVQRMPHIYRRVIDKYAYRDGRGRHILCWDHARFINHCCNASCLSPGFQFEIAVRDIQPGEELTDDYAALNLSEPFTCLCGSANCRKRVAPEDFAAQANRWDELLRPAFDCLSAVEQPLWSLVREKSQIRAVLAGDEPLPSCRVHQYIRPLAAKALG